MMKFVYIIVSDKDDYYFEQLLVSVTSLISTNPGAYITLVMDKYTDNLLSNDQKGVLSKINEIKVIDLDTNLSKKSRSRLLKTNLRNIVDGDFLYIDSDTIVLERLFAENIEPDLAAVHHLHFTSLENSPMMANLHYYSQRLNLDLSSNEYFNGGVIWARDTKQNRNFFNEWNRLYKKFLFECAIDSDQISLYFANISCNYLLKELSGVWNWQIGYGLSFWNNAKVLHLLTDVYSKRQEACVHFLQKQDTLLKIRNKNYDSCFVNDLLLSVKTGFTPQAGIIAYKLDNRHIYEEIFAFSKGKEIYVFSLNQISHSTIYEFEKRGVLIKGLFYSNDNAYNINGGILEAINLESFQGRKCDIGIIIMTRTNQLNQSIRTVISFGFTYFYVIVTDSWYKA